MKNADATARPESTPPDENAQLELAQERMQAGLASKEMALTPGAGPSPMAILESAVRAVNEGKVTGESVMVVKELVQLCREQRAEEAKAAFAKAFFQLRKNMPSIYADREAKDRSGNPVYSYCSEEEISKALEPHLMAHGFAMLFGQSSANGFITVNVTLMHEAGHSETREFTVRAGTPNAMKDGAMCDAGGATTAWRHLMMKMFGLKSRISDGNDARIIGEKIGADKVQYLREQLAEAGGTPDGLLKLAGVDRFEDIGEAVYPVLVRALEARKKNKR